MWQQCGRPLKLGELRFFWASAVVGYDVQAEIDDDGWQDEPEECADIEMSYWEY
jgi:hypothetical protein